MFLNIENIEMLKKKFYNKKAITRECFEVMKKNQNGEIY